MNIIQIPGMAAQLALAKDKAIAKIGASGFNTAVGGRILPPMPPFVVSGKENFAHPEASDMPLYTEAEVMEYSIFGTPMVFPLKVKLESAPDTDWWLLPLEPMITINGSNKLIRRSVAKVSKKNKVRRGTVKERWSSDDITISIEGMLTSVDSWEYPYQDVKRLREILEAREPISVQCPLFEIFSIGRMSIDVWDIPFTKGEPNQAYRLTAYSDDEWDLIIKK